MGGELPEKNGQFFQIETCGRAIAVAEMMNENMRRLTSVSNARI